MFSSKSSDMKHTYITELCSLLSSTIVLYSVIVMLTHSVQVLIVMTVDTREETISCYADY